MAISTVDQQSSAALQAADLAAAGLTSSGASGTATTSATSNASNAKSAQNALLSLTNNFQDFLSLLTTQLQAQDPTNPMDTNAFTTQLVQMANVEQQISTNTNLTNLIQVTQGSAILQSSSMVGKTVLVSSNEMSLQNGTAGLQFTAPAAEPVAIAVYDANNNKVLDGTVQAVSGVNNWTWNGQNADGTTMPDGLYKVAVIGANQDGTTAALPFSIVGTATAVAQSTSGELQLQLGSLAVDFGKVQSVVSQ